MKKIVILCLIACAVTNAWAQQADQLMDRIYTADNQVVEARVVEVSSREVRYKDWDNQNGPLFILTAAEIQKIEFSNGTVKTFAGTAAQPAQPTQLEDAQPAQPAQPAKPAPTIGFQFNIDAEGNLAFLSGGRISKYGIQCIDNDFAVGGVDLILSAGVRIAEWMYAGLSFGVLGEWGNPKVRYTYPDGKMEEGHAAYAAYTVPIYADVRAYAPTHGNCFPYAEVGIGGYVGLDGTVQFNGNKIDELCGRPADGFYFLSGVGLEFRYLNIGAGYKLMRNNNFSGNHGYIKLGISLGRPQKLRR